MQLLFARLHFDVGSHPAQCVNDEDGYVTDKVNGCPVVESEIHSQ